MIYLFAQLNKSKNLLQVNISKRGIKLGKNYILKKK